jgi:hypothetical protein
MEEEKQAAARSAYNGLLARQAFKRGEIEMCQSLRMKDGKRDGYDYVAQKRKEVRPPMVHGVPWEVSANVQNQYQYRASDYKK